VAPQGSIPLMAYEEYFEGKKGGRKRTQLKREFSQKAKDGVTSTGKKEKKCEKEEVTTVKG